MKLFFFLILLSYPVFALAVTPSSLDFSSADRIKLVVFNTEDYVREFSLSVSDSSFAVDHSSLRIPPRSSSYVYVSPLCASCVSRLYVREVSSSSGIRVEPVLVVRLSSNFTDQDSEEDFYDAGFGSITSFSFLNLPKPTIISFVVASSLLASLIVFLIWRKFYKHKRSSKLKFRKKKWLRKKLSKYL